MTRTCRYGCPVLLGEWNDNAKKYHEAATGELHTRERCEEAKVRARQIQGEKNNHGNESHSPKTIPTEPYAENIMKGGYVDHTQPQKLKLKVLTSTEAEGLALLYNSFGESHNIRFSQYQVAGSLYTMAVWYSEELK